jgi:hypothetical protein
MPAMSLTPPLPDGPKRKLSWASITAIVGFISAVVGIAGLLGNFDKIKEAITPYLSVKTPLSIVVRDPRALATVLPIWIIDPEQINNRLALNVHTTIEKKGDDDVYCRPELLMRGIEHQGALNFHHVDTPNRLAVFYRPSKQGSEDEQFGNISKGSVNIDAIYFFEVARSQYSHDGEVRLYCGEDRILGWQAVKFGDAPPQGGLR